VTHCCGLSTTVGHRLHVRQYSVSRRMRSCNAPALAPVSTALAGRCCQVRNFHIQIKRPVPSVVRKNTAIGTAHATLSNPPRIGAASTIAPYFAVNQFRIEVSEPPPSICVCNSPIMPGDTGHPTWLQSSSTAHTRRHRSSHVPPYRIATKDSLLTSPVKADKPCLPAPIA
jgi:hypothetical protein